MPASAALAGRVVAIDGAAGSLGPAVAGRLAAAGASLALAGRDREKLESMAKRLDVTADIESVDLMDEAAARAWADRLGREHGHLDGLVHLVGGWRGGTPIEEAPPDEWESLHDQLVRTTQNATRAFAPHLIASGHGRFVIVSSSQAQAPTHRNAAYAAAKAAAETWTLALADRFKGTGATANVVVVGAILTPEMRAAEPERDFSTFTPAEEIAESIEYLLSDAAASMNGQRIRLLGARG
jgi:NAD(P)-dependent dehydrogenase (short-subunit alcohol dehydrogenase family)